jgi:hypothetical protein
LRGKYASVQKALAALSNDASDKNANQIAGQWYCFVKGDWDKGLTMLAKGNRTDLADLAKRELAKPAAAKDRVDLADAWWALGEKEQPSLKSAAQARARHWYQDCLPQLTGLEKAHAEKRLEQVVAIPKETRSVRIKSRGKILAGNVALSSNGARILGTIRRPEVMLSGTVSTSAYSQAAWPCEWIIELSDVYELREIRFLLNAMDRRFYRYTLSVSANGTTFTTVADHSRDEARMWQDINFSPRPVKQIKINGLYNSANGDFHVHTLEAYCIPPGHKN